MSSERRGDPGALYEASTRVWVDEHRLTVDKVLIVHRERAFIDQLLFDLLDGVVFFPEITRAA
jgi:hypothetical protein